MQARFVAAGARRMPPAVWLAARPSLTSRAPTRVLDVLVPLQPCFALSLLATTTSMRQFSNSKRSNSRERGGRAQGSNQNARSNVVVDANESISFDQGLDDLSAEQVAALRAEADDITSRLHFIHREALHVTSTLGQGGGGGDGSSGSAETTSSAAEAATSESTQRLHTFAEAALEIVRNFSRRLELHLPGAVMSHVGQGLSTAVVCEHG
jgi:hypothetical protein